MKKVIVLAALMIALLSACKKQTEASLQNNMSLPGNETPAGVPPCYYPLVGVSTFAGSATPSNTDGSLKTAGVSGPMAITSFGDIIYFSTYGRIRKIQANVVSTIYTHSTGPTATIFITDMATDYDGNLYVAFGNEYVIRKISPGGTVLATYGVPNVAGYSNIPPYRFQQISGVAVDIEGRLYISDRNYVVRRLNTDGTMELIAGQLGLSGTTEGPISVARFSGNFGALAVTPYGDKIYVDDDTRVRVISGGNVNTIAGSTSRGHVDGNGGSARFGSILDMDIDVSGNLYITEYHNSFTDEYFYVRKVIRMTSGLIAWKVTTLAGGLRGFANGDGAAAKFNFPWSLTVNPGITDIYVADHSNNRIRRLNLGCLPSF